MPQKRLPSPPYNPGVHALVKGKAQWAEPLSQEEKQSGFMGWHENGYLPHRDEPGLIQFVTFRLHEAFPAELRSEWEFLFKIENERTRRLKLEEYLDKGRGPCYCANPRIAGIVESSLLFRHGKTYDLRAWVIMPNHVHVLFQTWDVPMAILLRDWKRYSAREANKVLRRTGKLWQDDYWDTYMRNEEQEIRCGKYIENNPVKARLIKTKQNWRWSSVRFRNSWEKLCLPGSI